MVKVKFLLEILGMKDSLYTGILETKMLLRLVRGHFCTRKDKAQKDERRVGR